MDSFLPVADSVFSFFEIHESYMPAAGDEASRFQELRKVLIRRIEELIDKDTEKLMWVLYRIDVSEQKVKEALAANTSANHAEVIADLIIARQIEKVKTRAEHSSGAPDWSFDV
ncbi:MAG: hypothetical protein JSS76_00875 [Bacteroidetes bacterium]|nr:hypothetical protein [Bacteroidota bacterium]MBS1683276.1 hypothetical protein [Bacteroidota bacterium]